MRGTLRGPFRETSLEYVGCAYPTGTLIPATRVPPKLTPLVRPLSQVRETTYRAYDVRAKNDHDGKPGYDKELHNSD